MQAMNHDDLDTDWQTLRGVQHTPVRVEATLDLEDDWTTVQGLP